MIPEPTCEACTYPLPHNHIEPEWVPATVDQITAGQTVRLEHGDGSVLVRKMFQWGDPFSLLRHTLESAEITTPEIERLIQNGWGLFVQATPKPALQELPTEPGTVIMWEDGAYLPHIAHLDPKGRLGWRSDNRDNAEQWYSVEALAEYIKDAPFVRLAPVPETAKALLKRVRSAMAMPHDGTRPDGRFIIDTASLDMIAAEYGVTD